MNKFYTLGVEAHSIVLGLVNEDLFVCGKKKLGCSVSDFGLNLTQFLVRQLCKHAICWPNSIRPSVCHTGGSAEHGYSYGYVLCTRL